MSQPRYILLGGFFGAGKTTALTALAQKIAALGRRVAVIANDHGGESIDPAEFRLEGFPTEEVGGGDLATRFPSLVAAAKKLEAGAPDIVLVEAVGTSLDLAATVLAPLRQIEGMTVAPLSILVDPVRAEQVLGLAPGQPLDPHLLYLFRQQLEEAQIIVIAQTDRLDETSLERLRQKLAEAFPLARIVAISAAPASGFGEWLKLLEADAVEFPAPPECNAAAYAEGAAAVGYANAIVEFTLSSETASASLQESIARHLRQALEGVDVLHLQVALRADEALIGAAHLVGNGEPRISRAPSADLEFGELLINVRAATHPEKLHTAVRAAIVGMTGEFPGMISEFAYLHYFRAAKPEPLHRLKPVSA